MPAAKRSTAKDPVDDLPDAWGVRFTFGDGSTWVVPAGEFQRRIRNLRAAFKRVKRDINRANGKRGGRPRGPAPTKEEILLRFGDRWLSPWKGGDKAARSWLVKMLAGEHETDERQVRRWVERALGPRK
jgi:hypothetical protein